jgi:hypothetical protein
LEPQTSRFANRTVRGAILSVSLCFNSTAPNLLLRQNLETRGESRSLQAATRASHPRSQTESSSILRHRKLQHRKKVQLLDFSRPTGIGPALLRTADRPDMHRLSAHIQKKLDYVTMVTRAGRPHLQSRQLLTPLIDATGGWHTRAALSP